MFRAFALLLFMLAVSAYPLNVSAAESSESTATGSADVQQLTDQIKQSPNRSILYAKRGQIYVGLENWKMALSDTSRAIEIDPNNSSYYVARASIFDALGKYVAERSDLNKALQLRPDNVEGMKSLGIFYSSHDKDFVAAEKVLSRAITFDPKYTDLYLLRAESLNNQGKFEDATLDCNRALKIEPASKNAMMVMGEIKTARQKKPTH